MRIGKNPTAVDRMRLDFFRAAADDTVKNINDFMAEDTHDSGATMARFAAMYRAEGAYSMACLLEPHSSFIELLEFRLMEQFHKNVTEQDRQQLRRFFDGERAPPKIKREPAPLHNDPKHVLARARIKKWRSDKKSRDAGAAA
jgi:hypothetical protein